MRKYVSTFEILWISVMSDEEKFKNKPIITEKDESQLLAGAELFPRAISCTQATQSDSINSIASAS